MPLSLAARSGRPFFIPVANPAPSFAQAPALFLRSLVLWRQSYMVIPVFRLEG